MRWPLILAARLLLGTTLLAQGGNPTNCPYVRYILFDACTRGNEGNDELLIFYTPVPFNINNLNITFPNPATTNWCYTCADNFTCTGGNTANVLNYLNTNACTGTTYTCPAAGATIPANSWIILFTGINVSNNYPNPSALCGAGTVYVLFANNTDAGGRYLNNPDQNTNRRTIITFTGMSQCNMTVNYRGNFPTQDGNYLLIDPSICIGKTEGQNNVNPSASACYHYGSGTSNGVSRGNVGSNCPLPGLSVLPILWREVRVVGDRLRWAVAFEGEAVRPLSLWHQASPESPPYLYRTGLGARGELPLERTGLYYLTIQGAEGTDSRSPAVWYEGDGRPYVRYEGRTPVIERSEEVVELQVWDMSGRVVLSAAAPVDRAALSPLSAYGAGVYSVFMRLRSGEVRQERILLMP